MSEETTGSTTPEGGDWRSSLPEGFGEASFIKGADSAEAALTAINNAAAHMGNSIRIPGEDASDDARNEFYGKILEKAPNLMPKPSEDSMDAFYASIGRPQDATGYAYEAPEGRDVPTDFEAFSQVAHKHGLSQEQFKGVLGDLLEGQWSQMDGMTETHNGEMQDLRGKWGMAYDDNMSAVKNFLRLTDAPEGVVELMTEGAMSAKEIEWIHSVANSTKSSTELSQQTTTTVPNMMTPDEATMKISEMLNNVEHPYWNNSDPGHQRAVARMLELQKMAHPEKEQRWG